VRPRSAAVGGALAALLAVAGAGAAWAEDDPSEEATDRSATVLTSPLVLVDGATSRVELISSPVTGREANLEERREAARGWLSEALAPLAASACRAVFAALADRPALDTARLAGWSEAFPAARPIAEAPGAEQILVPERSPPLDRAALELLSASGMLPIEVALAGEGARVAAARHAGPPLRPELLRHARAARLEGVARLAGILEVLEGTGVEPSDVGVRLLGADRDRVGWDRRKLIDAAGDPVVRALLKGMVQDGLRWALYHHLRGGHQALASALERPGVGPERLLRPGRPRIRTPEGWPAEGCRLGPRGALALVFGQDELPWLDGLAADVFWAADDGKVEGRLLFDGERDASEAGSALAGKAVEVVVEGPELRLTWGAAAGDGE
jgi:hypothetical protein